MKKIIGSGAEAIIYHDKNIIKDRIKKDYRIQEIDSLLRKSRTRREAKVLETLQEMDFPAPKLIRNDRTSIIEMEYIEGDKLSEVLEKKDYKRVSREIGKRVAQLHNRGIIHGDLTTSNMILKDKLYLIDFGLSFFSGKVEDKAVDLHLLRQALESKHHTIWRSCFSKVLESYKRYAKKEKEILKRLEGVESRGRNKQKSS